MSIQGLTFLDDQAKMPLMVLPVRTTVIEVTGGRVMFSPGSMMSEAQLRSAGDITDIVAPSFLHTDGGPVAAKVFPNARLWGPPGMRDKHPGHTWLVLGEDPWPHEKELRVIAVGGMPKVREHLLYHVASKSLMVVDLFFNLVDAKGLGARLFLGAFGSWRRFALSRMYKMLVKDKGAFVQSLKGLAKLDLQNVVPTHGALVEGGAKEKVVGALRERGLAID